jgi:hypothetical protein
MLPKLMGCSIGGVAGGQEWLRCAIRSRGNVDERLHGDLFARFVADALTTSTFRSSHKPRAMAVSR